MITQPYHIMYVKYPEVTKQKCGLLFYFFHFFKVLSILDLKDLHVKLQPLKCQENPFLVILIHSASKNFQFTDTIRL